MRVAMLAVTDTPLPFFFLVVYVRSLSASADYLAKPDSHQLARGRFGLAESYHGSSQAAQWSLAGSLIRRSK